MTASEAYIERFRRVLEFIDAHLDEDLCIDRLSGVAAFSRFHFHRQFSELMGVSVHSYVQQVRMRRAAYRLTFRRELRILDVALDSGYQSHEAFSRAFKKTVGQRPSEFRKRPEWGPWHASYQPTLKLRSQIMSHDLSLSDVKIIDFAETPVAALEHRGPEHLVPDSVRRFIAWRKANHTSPGVSATFNVFRNEAEHPAPGDFRLDICAAIAGPVAPNDAGVVEKTIPAGRCAVLRHIGSDDTLRASVSFLYRTWLPSSGEELRDFPIYLQRVRFSPEVPEHEAVVDVFLPLR